MNDERQRGKEKQAAQKVKVSGIYLSFLYMFNRSACLSVMTMMMMMMMMKVGGIGKEKKIES
jgi:hypothetical protein